MEPIVGRMREDGVALLPGLITPEWLRDIRAYLSTKLCYDNHDRSKPGIASPEDAHKTAITGYYELEDVMRLPHLPEVANAPRILTAVEEELGCKPTISFMSLWWSFSSFDHDLNACIIGNQDVLHRDLDDWKQLKLFVYLTDVSETTGPHAFVRGSHRRPAFRRVRDAEIGPNHPERGNLTLLSGPAGTAFLENSSVLHRAIAPVAGPRLMLHVAYTLLPVPYPPKGLHPVPADVEGLDPYINRLFFRKASGPGRGATSARARPL